VFGFTVRLRLGFGVLYLLLVVADSLGVWLEGTDGLVNGLVLADGLVNGLVASDLLVVGLVGNLRARLMVSVVGFVVSVVGLGRVTVTIVMRLVMVDHFVYILIIYFGILIFGN